MRIYIIFLFAILLSPLTYAEAPKGYPFLSFDTALKKSIKQNKVMFVYFGRYGCGYCDKTNKEAFSDRKVRELYSTHYVLAYIDSESGKRLKLPNGERITEREIGTRYNAFVTPVFTFMTPDGKPIYQMVGVQRIEDLIIANNKVQTHIKQGQSK